MFSLNQALEAIKNKPEFSVKERDGFTVIDYNITLADTFKGETPEQTHILCNLRGTIFDTSTGEIIRLMWHKFMNLGQDEEYAPTNFNFADSHIIEEKLDGSLIGFFMLPNGTIRAGTRAGITDISVLAEKFLGEEMEKNKAVCYGQSIMNCIRHGFTPMFEFCSRLNRVVVDHPETKLVWTGLRSMKTGKYENLQVLSAGLGVEPIMDFVSVIGTESSSISELAEIVRQYPATSEGVVVKFIDGRMVKIKGEAYVLIHRTLDEIRWEKDVLKMVLTGVLDDVLPLVQPDAKERLVAYNDSVWTNIKGHTAALHTLFESLKIVPTKKDFAELVKSSPYRAALFKLYDGKKFDFAEFASTKCGSSSDVESIRWLVGKSYLEF